MVMGDFSNQASAYKLARPSYPRELVEQLIQDAGVVAGDPVADFGAGTGIFTRLLADQGLSVTAVEPNAVMRRQAEADGAVWVDGTFEDSHLPTGSQRWAVAAQAFHWADPQRSLPEIRRILRSGSLFTVLWNSRSAVNDPIVEWTHAQIRTVLPDFEETYRRGGDKIALLESTGDFTFHKYREASHVVPMSRERFLQLWKSHNQLNVLAGPERFQKLYETISEELSRQNIEQILMHYNCESWSARRKD